MLVAETNSPQTLRRGKGTFSTMATDQPALASINAAVVPAGPAPMMSASYFTGSPLLSRLNVARYEAMGERPRRALM
jgi:hypothetical protein